MKVENRTSFAEIIPLLLIFGLFISSPSKDLLAWFVGGGALIGILLAVVEFLIGFSMDLWSNILVSGSMIFGMIAGYIYPSFRLAGFPFLYFLLLTMLVLFYLLLPVYRGCTSTKEIVVFDLILALGAITFIAISI